MSNNSRRFKDFAIAARYLGTEGMLSPIEGLDIEAEMEKIMAKTSTLPRRQRDLVAIRYGVKKKT